LKGMVRDRKGTKAVSRRTQNLIHRHVFRANKILVGKRGRQYAPKKKRRIVYCSMLGKSGKKGTGGRKG